ncbi:hypothetical protein TREES_T100017973 [Tupaia chinensis]|uniref:Uncharacterized protein n=1 Tax=Tupaia chinensis TaxID=246437 RepID=L9JUE0_TUPCH|nr:hypothetical protein TREES_T100017973 [Tupaia chinensis]
MHASRGNLMAAVPGLLRVGCLPSRRSWRRGAGNVDFRRGFPGFPSCVVTPRHDVTGKRENAGKLRQEKRKWTGTRFLPLVSDVVQMSCLQSPWHEDLKRAARQYSGFVLWARIQIRERNVRR